MKRFILILSLVLLGSASAFAANLEQAKSQGLIGERNDGYLGLVVSSASDDVKALVKDVNNKRKAKFSNTAKKNNLQTQQVANRFYQRAVKETKSGDYYQNATGSWVKK